MRPVPWRSYLGQVLELVKAHTCVVGSEQPTLRLQREHQG
jgi:hypothetical protein